jgi:tRNA(fMet)-specific endonuclease VapC
VLYLLDTNICSAIVKRDAAVRSKLQTIDPADVCISAITRAEIRFGLARRPEATKLAEAVNAVLQFIRTEPWDSATADRHGLLRAHLRNEGRPIGDFDEMIAAHALTLGAVLVTNNEKHFRQVPGLKLENWLNNH